MGILRTVGSSILLAAVLVGVLLSTTPPTVSAAAAARQSAAAAAAEPSPPATATTSTQTVDTPRDHAKEQRDLRHANAVLAKLKKTYRDIDDVTLTVGPTPNGHQAVSYYTTGEIVLSPDRVASIDKILAHEIWHIIDWRDNGRLDWGEDLPPSNSSDYHNGK